MYADTKGYMIRDLGIISVALGFLKNIDSDAITLKAVPPDYQQKMSDSSVQDILKLYKDTIQASPTSMLELGLNNTFTCGYYYYGQVQNPEEYFGDYHPNTEGYLRYLELLKIPLTELSHEYTEESMTSLRKENTLEGIQERFTNLIQSRWLVKML
jgi:hypothetical protein